MINVSAPYLIDAYKIGHIAQYPEGLSFKMSNFTPRKSRVPHVDEVVWIGTSYFIQEYLVNHWDSLFFRKGLSQREGEFYASNVNKIIGPNKIGGAHIAALHKLKYLPIKIKSIPEGDMVKLGVPTLVIHSTVPEFAWLVNYLESLLSCVLWLPATTGTTAFHMRLLLEKHVEKVGGIRELVKWQIHDFSFRGMPGIEAACMSGFAHLCVAQGTDTVPALFFAQQYYNNENGTLDITEIGGSVNATEHSVMCLNAEYIELYKENVDGSKTLLEVLPNEFKSFARLIRKFGYGIMSVVGDSFNFWKVLDDYLPHLKDEIMNRHHYVCHTDGQLFKVGDWFLPNIDMETGKVIDYYSSSTEQNYPIETVTTDPTFSRVEGKLVIRGDSGDPVKILTGYFGEELEEYKDGRIFFNKKQISLTERKGLFEALYDVFGGTLTSKGYKTLDQHIGAIYGDGINYDRLKEILERLEEKNFYMNGVMGIGSYSYQYVTRDTFGWAMKATYGEIITGTEMVEGNLSPIITKKAIYKDPITDDGTKKSAKGITAVFKDKEGSYYLKDQATMEEFENCDLITVYENGSVPMYPSLLEIRERVDANINRYLTRKQAA